MARNLLLPSGLNFAAAPWRQAAFLCAIGMASLLSACGGGGDGDGASGGPSYTLGGRLSGLAAGQTLDVTNGSETLTLSANGAFTFATRVAQGGSYEVKVSGAQPAWQTCSASSAAGSAVSADVSTVVVNCVSADTAATGQLNDTGIDWCSENFTTPSTWVNNAVCSAVNWVGNLWGQQQDAFFGRDAQAKAGTLTKVGGGVAGFDYTKIGARGKVLVKQGEAWSDTGTEAAGTQWDCVRDNVTGLVWEVKRNDATHLRHFGHSYTWYNPETTTNGGNAGTESSSACTGVADTSKCNTQSYVTAVNAVGLCGKKDWRIPTIDELASLFNIGRNSIPDSGYFPNTVKTPNSLVEQYLSSTSVHITGTEIVKIASFESGGFIGGSKKSDARRVRLVRSGQ